MRCAQKARGYILADNRQYKFANGYAIGFVEKRPYTKETDSGFVPTKSEQAAPLREELQRVNIMREILEDCKNNMWNQVCALNVTQDAADIWHNAFAVCRPSSVTVCFPDAQGTVTYRRPLIINTYDEEKRIALSCQPSVIDKLHAICTAACLSLSRRCLSRILEAAYFQEENMECTEAYGYALVLIMQNATLRSGFLK